MKLILSKQEYLKLREIIINIDNENVTTEFNKVVTNRNPHITSATTSDTISISVSDELSAEIGTILITHSKGIGKNLNTSLAGIPKLISQGKKLLSDLSKAVKKTKK